MDIQKLRTAIFEKTGVRVDEIDPIFTLVALNEALLEQTSSTLSDALAKNNAELDERIGSIVVLHRTLVGAAENLVERANQAHMTAALKAAAEAKKEIMTAAQEAVRSEVEKSAAIITKAVQELADESQNAKANRQPTWLFASVQAVIGGIVAGATILTAMHFIH